MGIPSKRIRAVGVIFAADVKEGDVVFASYHVVADGKRPNEAERPGGNQSTKLVCAWVVVNTIKHHTDTTVTMFSSVLDEPGKTHRWVEYPLEAPLVLGIQENR